MATTLPPVDESVAIPESVKRAAALAESFYQGNDNPQQSPEPAPSQASTPDPQPQPQSDAAPPVEPAPETASQSDAPRAEQAPVAVSEEAPHVQPSRTDLQDSEWARRYNSMKGRFDQSQNTIAQMQEQLVQMGDEIMRLNQHLQQPAHQPQQEPRPQAVKMITPEDEANYGSDLIDLARRAAQEALSPELLQLREQNQKLQRTLTQTRQQTVREALDEQIPNWREIQKSQRFQQWLRLPDVYSGRVRGQMLNAAYQAAQAPRVLAFYRGFLQEEAATGHQPAAPTSVQSAPQTPREPAVQLASLAAPGRATRPATGSQPNVPVDKPIYTRQQVGEFYRHVREGRYAGREAEKDTLEQAIFAAQREGRVR